MRLNNNIPEVKALDTIYEGINKMIEKEVESNSLINIERKMALVDVQIMILQYMQEYIKEDLAFSIL